MYKNATVASIKIGNLVMSIVDRESNGFRITVKQAHCSVLAVIWLAIYNIYKKLLVS